MQPTPLFRKIELTEVDDLKSRFAGKQEQAKEESKQDKAVASPSSVLPVSGDAEELKNLINRQGDKVRQLKEAGESFAEALADLKTLKEQWLASTGQPWDPPKSRGGKSKAKK